MDHTALTRDRVRRRRGRIAVVAAAVLGLGLTATLAPGASAAPAKKAPVVVKTDVREIDPHKKFSTKDIKAKAAANSKARAKVRAQAESGATPPVGTTRTLIGLDDYKNKLLLKSYTLQAV